MKIVGAVLSILYGLLMIFAVFKGKQKGIATVLILIGAVLSLIYALLSLISGNSYIFILIAGMVSISAGAFINGYKQKNLHILHHIIRLIVEAVIVVICVTGG